MGQAAAARAAAERKADETAKRINLPPGGAYSHFLLRVAEMQSTHPGGLAPGFTITWVRSADGIRESSLPDEYGVMASTAGLDEASQSELELRLTKGVADAHLHWHVCRTWRKRYEQVTAAQAAVQEALRELDERVSLPGTCAQCG